MSKLKDCVTLHVEAEPRYWEDAYVNGVEDVLGTLIPLKDDKLWKIKIDLEAGKIQDWPEGTTAYIHYKVCDQGEYWLADHAGNRLFKWYGLYVPDRFLCIDDLGFGDYIIFNVNEKGFIEGWKKPDLKDDEWVVCE